MKVKLLLEIQLLQSKALAIDALTEKVEALEIKSSSLEAELESAPALINKLASKVSTLGPSDRKAAWALLCEQLRKSRSNGAQLKLELKQSVLRKSRRCFVLANR